MFSDYMLEWLQSMKPNIENITFAGYTRAVKNVIVPYFEPLGIALKDLKASDIQRFYNHELQKVSAKTLQRYHANIHKALKDAVRMDIIVSNPAEKVTRPKAQKFVGSFYHSEEINQLFEFSKGTCLEMPILFGAFYGLRRAEIVGLWWTAIDFRQNTISIRHTVNSYKLEGKKMVEAKDRAKTKSSMRTLPLVPVFRDYLLQLKKKQEEYRRLCGNSYCKDYLDYLYVDELGRLIEPNYITHTFPSFLKKHELRKIRFHDLRHSCASLLLANNVPMKQIQEWLGHSDFSTTANIYAHLDYNSKLSSASALMAVLGFSESTE
ncbi:site-specific integrase [Lacrimispora sp. BS-2]|uniref:Site-specific integrase n=1 Tax=Lacrimispora sp. BS-2 TaxID=3151850 RepID=A0AAU7PLR8_9FIRM